MSTIFIKPLTTLNHHPKFNNNNIFHATLKVSAKVHKKLIRFKKRVASESMETKFINRGDDDKLTISPAISAFEQEALVNDGGASHYQTRTLHTRFNGLSKWVVGATFGGFIFLNHVNHDALASWAATGCISNFILSVALKRILKQDRPISEVSSGHGMPSSHAQTVFFTLVFVIVSVIERMGLNGATTILGTLLIALGSYFSWLRVLLGYHTISQVIAGTFVGSSFAIFWFWAWEKVVCDAYNSNPWVQNLLFVGGACYYIGFISFFVWHLIKDY